MVAKLIHSASGVKRAMPAAAADMIERIGSHARQMLEPSSFGQVHPEPVAAALIPAGHLGAGVAELLLHMPLVDLG